MKSSKKKIIFLYKKGLKDIVNIWSDTYRPLETRKAKHMKAFKCIGYSRIADHYFNYGHDNNWDVNIIAIESNDTKRITQKKF